MQSDEIAREPRPRTASDVLVVRHAEPYELAEIAAFKRAVESDTYAALATPAELASRLEARCTVEFLVRCLAVGDALFVARYESRVVAVGAVGLRSQAPTLTAHLHSLYCRPQRAGTGRTVTRSRLFWAAARGATGLTADCLAGNDAAAAHLTRLGMVDTGERAPSPDFAHVELCRFEGDMATALQVVAAADVASSNRAAAA